MRSCAAYLVRVETSRWSSACELPEIHTRSRSSGRAYQRSGTTAATLRVTTSLRRAAQIGVLYCCSFKVGSGTETQARPSVSLR